MSPDLRPIERVILRLRRENVATTEIANRVGKSPGTIIRILEMIEFKQGNHVPASKSDHPLRPLERVVLRLRLRGESYGLIGNRLGRSGGQIRRIEGYAHFKS